MVGSIGSGAYNAAFARESRTQAADQIMKRADANRDGKITEAELGNAIEAAGGKQSSSVKEIFNLLDQGGKGYLTKQDLEDGLSKAAQSQPTQGKAAGASGGGPARGGGGAAGASSTATADPEDLNQDGTVTQQEKIQYLLTHYAKAASASTTPAAKAVSVTA